MRSEAQRGTREKKRMYTENRPGKSENGFG